MNAEEILTEVYWDLSPLNADQIKYPDHDTLRKQLKKYLNSRYGIIAKEGNMAGILNAQVQEWYKNNVDLLSVIDKLTKRCEKLEEENTHLKDEVKAAVSREEVTKKNLEWRTHEVTDLNNCLAKKNATIKELRQKITAITEINALDFNAIFTSLGVDDTRSALDKIMEMKKLIKQNEEDSYLIDQQRKTDAENYKNLQIAHDNLVDKYEELQASYDNCVNECSDHVIEIDSLLQNLEVETVKHGIEKIKALKDGWMIKFDFSAEADLRLENAKLKMKIEDLRKDVKFEFDHRMAVLAASVDQDAKIAELKETIKELRQKNYDLSRVLQEETIGKKRAESENDKLKSFIKDRTKEIHEMSEEIEKRLAKYRKEEEDNEL